MIEASPGCRPRYAERGRLARGRPRTTIPLDHREELSCTNLDDTIDRDRSPVLGMAGVKCGTRWSRSFQYMSMTIP
jgi:hypothetical protein